MIGIINITPGSIRALTTAHSVVATCSLGAGVPATGLSGVRTRAERPAGASAVLAAAQAKACAFAAAAADAGACQKQQYSKHHTMWAFRGPEPWRDPA
ncbi:hypothetical protein [Streptomyces chumphonensis]|uniref:hypothetical protein n=1 Tax=Streptomyces chumphonensis TaxID=1214925 RepID=UPI003D751A4E